MAGEGKVVGIKWHNRKVVMRLDWDPTKGPHINVVDYRMGKGANGISVAIPFRGDLTTIESLLKHLNNKNNIAAVQESLKRSGSSEILEFFLQHLKEN